MAVFGALFELHDAPHAAPLGVAAQGAAVLIE